MSKLQPAELSEQHTLNFNRKITFIKITLTVFSNPVRLIRLPMSVLDNGVISSKFRLSLLADRVATCINRLLKMTGRVCYLNQKITAIFIDQVKKMKMVYDSGGN